MADDLGQFLLKAPKGTVLFKEGDSGDTMFFIHSGKVRIEMDVDGKPEVLAHMEKGDFFGEMAVLDRVPRTATAIVEETADLLKIDQANFEKLLKANIEIAVRMIRKYASRLRDTNQKLETHLKDKSAINKGIVEIIESTKKSSESSPSVLLPLAELKDPKKGILLSILKTPASIGRIDPVTNIIPEIDLTVLDESRSVSRKHARIEWIDGEFFVLEEVGVANGTLVNGKKIVAGSPTQIITGTKLQFGQVELVFSIKTNP